MRTTLSAIAALAILGVGAAQSGPASASPNAKECPAGVTLSASASGRTVTVSVSPAVNLKPATDADPDSFHLHYFVDTDPATVLQAGQAVPAGNPQIVHSAATTQEFKELSAGSHRIWVVLGDFAHVTCTPLVVDDVALTVSAASTAPATGSGDALNRGAGPISSPWAILALGVIVTGAGLTLSPQVKRAR